MNRIVEFLEKNQMQYMATVGLDGKPKVRPFQYMFEDEGKLWFCTSNKKEVYREMQNQPYIELSASNDNVMWLRIEGKVVFVDNINMKEKVLEISPLVKGIYKEANNPDLEVFYLQEAIASLSEIGKPPIIIKF
jgi:uncharacterized pyridoxamine 5'-phosphate oxidase family protein